MTEEDKSGQNTIEKAVHQNIAARLADEGVNVAGSQEAAPGENSGEPAPIMANTEEQKNESEPVGAANIQAEEKTEVVVEKPTAEANPTVVPSKP